MKNVALLTAVTAATLIWASPAQELLEPAQDSLVPVPGTPVTFDAARWAKALRDPDLVARKRAYETVLDEAGRRDAAYQAVKSWASATTDVELAWTAQLMLRELDADPFRGLLQPRSPRSRGFGFGPGRHDDLLKEFEDLFDHYRALDPWKDLSGSGGAGPWSGSKHSEGLSVESTPDGVRVEVREMIDGKEEIQTYEAESMDALLEAHPELEEQLGGRLQIRFGTGDPFDRTRGLLDPRSGLGDFFQTRPETPRDLGRLRPIEPRTDVLGVRVLGPEDRVQPVEGVPSHLGLEVVEVLPGSLAALVGIEVGEIVISINGEEIASPEDVKRALAERGADGPLKVEVSDAEGDIQFRSWKPAPTEARKY